MSKKTLSCGDLFPGCDARVEDESVEGVMRQAAEHARAKHGLESIDAATAAKVQAAIRDA
jgi:predicted small metal-binding protein